MRIQPGVSTRQGRHWVWHLVLAVAILLAQVTLVRHSLQHLTKADPDAAHAVCVECLGLHAADHLGSAPPVPTMAHLAPARADLPHWAATWLAAEAPRPYQSRAPPALSA